MAGAARLAAEPGLTGTPLRASIAAMEAGNGTGERRRWYQRIADIRGPWVWLAYLPLFGATWLGHPPSAIDLIASAAGIALFLPLYVLAWRMRGLAVIAAAFGVLAISFALIPFGGNWAVISVYACSTGAELRPPRAAIALVAVLIAATAVVELLTGVPWYFVAMIALFQAMVVYGKMSGRALGEKHGALLRAQGEVRRLAQEAERERIARDLHDLLGRTLTLIALKSELAAKLAGTDVAAAEREMREVSEAARGGLAEVRAAVAGMTDAGLAREIEASRAALATAGIGCTIEGERLAVSAANGAVLAMALREAITNVIRHAGARQVGILLEDDGAAVRLTVTDDGQDGHFREGAGLRGMRARLSAAGGRLRVDASTGGTRVSAAVPARAA